MKYGFIDAHREEYSICRMCDALGVSRSGYYAWLNRPESRRSREDRRLEVEIRSEFRKSRETYGRVRMHRRLQERGIRCSPKRLARIMREAGLKPKKARRFRRTTQAAESHPKAPNILERDFTVEAPNMAWVGDITYLWTLEGWLYLAVVLDLFSRRVIGWSVSDRLDRSVALRALERAIVERGAGPGLVHHSDRGSQYTSVDYQELLNRVGFTASMSRKGDCWDNAVAESFFATLKVELGDSFSSRAAARRALFDYIEIFYNRQRLHSYNDYISPVALEERFALGAVA